MPIRPKVRDHVLADLFRVLMGDAVSTSGTADIVKNCINCQNFDESKSECMKYKQVPPPRVIAYGCIDHLDNFDIPF